MAVASLVLGILSIINALFLPAFPLGIVLSIVGIVLGALGKKVPEKAGMAKAGLVCSIIGLILSILFFALCAACIGGLAASA